MRSGRPRPPARRRRSKVVTGTTRRFTDSVNLHHLELFYYVARSGGISRAVRSIPYGIQQPAVSVQILALEAHLGTKLFTRQPFRLTDAGRELYAFACPFFDHVATVEERLRRDPGPMVRIAASELVLSDYLPTVMHELKQQHPTLRFQLRSGLQAEMERWLQDGEIDLAIVPLDRKPRPGLVTAPLVRLPLVLLVPRASKIKTAGELWARAPIGDVLISLPAAEAISQAFQRGLRGLKVDWPTGIEASSMNLVTRYVANGYGIGVTVGLPGLETPAGVRVVPLPGFEPIEVAALWSRPTNALNDALRTAILAQARALFPRAGK